MKPWLFLVPVVLLVGCAQQTNPPAEVATAPPPVVENTNRPLTGDDTGELWGKASPEQKLAFCKASMNSYKASGTASFSISAKTNSLTPEKLCQEMDSYYSGKGTGLKSDRLGHAAGMSIIFAGKPYRPPAS